MSGEVGPIRPVVDLHPTRSVMLRKGKGGDTSGSLPPTVPAHLLWLSLSLRLLRLLQEPMDLGTIWKKLSSHQYHSIEAILRDVQLVSASLQPESTGA